MLVINASDILCLSCHTNSARSDHMSGSSLFRLPVKIIDSLKQFAFYKFAYRMGADPVLTAEAFHRCSEVH